MGKLDHIDKVQAQAAAQLTKQQVVEQAILAKLMELGGQLVGEDSLEFGHKFVIPEQFREDLNGAIDFLQQYQAMMESTADFMHTYDYKPWDGARAVQNALRKNFGTSGIQRGPKMFSFFFGDTDLKAQQRSIPVAPGKSENIPWGRIEIPIFHGEMTLQAVDHKEKGQLFHLVISAPKKYAKAIEGLFTLVQKELEENSIYRGKAFDGADQPEFLNVQKLDESKIVYSDDVLLQLEANIWNFVKHGDILEQAGLDPKRAILLEGPYGTGKTLAGLWTAKLAEKYSVTFILCRPNDSLKEVMGTARLYQPSIVFFEDIDQLVTPGHTDAVSDLLDTFDGMRAKGNRVMIVMTTNHKEKIHKGMLRPGRMDAVITIAGLDVGGIKRMVESTLDNGMYRDLDYKRIQEACKDYLPAFVKEVIQRAVMYSIAKRGPVQSPLVTEDFVNAANGLRPQFDLMTGAAERLDRSSIEQSLRTIVQQALNKSAIVDENDGETYTHLETPKS